jgi:hypothetical protein
LDNANIKYNIGGKEPIITANSTLLGFVGNVLLDIQIDRGKHLTVDALVVDNLSSNCLIAWKDMQRAGIISPSFPANFHVTKSVLDVIPEVMRSEVTRSTTSCRVPREKEFTRSMPLCAVPDCTVPKSSDMSRKSTVPKRSDTSRKCTVPKCSDMSRKCTVPKCSDMRRKFVNMTDKSNKRVISPDMV